MVNLRLILTLSSVIMSINLAFALQIIQSRGYVSRIARGVEQVHQLLMGRKTNGTDKARQKKFTKSNLPSKICAVCGRPFEWRKKWEKDWDEVKYCSNRCRRSKSTATQTLSAQFLQRRKFSSFVYLPRSVGASVAFALLSLAIDFEPLKGGNLPCISSTLIRRADAAARINRPSKQELATVFRGDAWEMAKIEEFEANEFRRLDESADDRFYQEPRFVEHVDAAAVTALNAIHKQLLSESVQQQGRSIDVLDLCSSWVSHVPDSVSARSFAGLGMNMAELQRNPRLTARAVQDLNANTKFPYESDSFDVVLIQLSIDYLTKPVQVMQEISRVLRHGGKLIIT